MDKVRVLKDNDALAATFAADLVELINQKIKSSDDKLNLAISGGSTPKLLFDYLAKEHAKSIEWSEVNLFWVDERCVAPDHAESNYKMTKEHLLDHVEIPEKNIFRMRGEDDPREEANRYAKEIIKNVPQAFGVPRFDITLLGMGADGHTASIFPDQIVLMHSDHICEPAIHPTSKQKRITMSGKLINNSEQIFFLVAGGSKAKMIQVIFNDQEKRLKYPASHIKPIDGSLTWYLDESAASSM